MNRLLATARTRKGKKVQWREILDSTRRFA